MLIEPIILVELLITIFILATALIVLVIYYAKSLSSFHTLQKEEDHLKSQIHKKGNALLEEARSTSNQIITDANLKAQTIISSAHAFNNDSKIALDKKLEDVVKNQAESLEKASAELTKKYQKSFEELKEENINMLKKTSKDIEQSALNEVFDFKEILEKETLTAQKIIEQKIEDQYAKVQNEIQTYKTEKLVKIDELIYKIIQQVCEKVIGKTLSIRDHQDLVIEALSEAKQELK